MTKRQNTTARNEVFPKDITRFSKKDIANIDYVFKRKCLFFNFFCFQSMIYLKSSINSMLQMYEVEKLKF